MAPNKYNAEAANNNINGNSRLPRKRMVQSASTAAPKRHRTQHNNNDNDSDSPTDNDDAILSDNCNVTDNSGLGTIERVELVNFMCHSYLQVSLGSKINFIVGHNGSGKSAILTALTVCLGGKAVFTNRGNNLKALIKTGQDVGSVTVKIRNKGPDAYKPLVYGDCIVVERKISRDGPHSYKIKNASGQTVSTSHGDLMSINDHMQIVVDNPMAILTQDTARMFLANSSTQDKYQFFLKGTQLEKLAADYVLIDEYIDNSTHTLRNKVQAIPDMQNDVEHLRKQLREIDDAAKIEEEFHLYNAEFIWSKIEEQEQRITDQARLVEQESQKLVTVEPKILQCEADYVQTQAQAQQLSTQLVDTLAEKTPLDNARKDRHVQIKASNQLMRQLSNSISDLDSQTVLRKKNIDRLQSHIIVEQKKLLVDQASIRNAKLARIEQLESEKASITQPHVELLRARDEVEVRINTLRAEHTEIQEYISKKTEAIGRSNTKLRQLADQKANRLRMFGERMPEIVHMIEDYSEKRRWSGRKPIGPLGMYVQLEREEFSNVVETLLSGSLSAMVVETHDDLRLMQDIARKCGFPQMTIFKCTARNVDFRGGEPHPDLITIHRCLKVDNPTVLGQLVINNGIEKTVLVHTRAEGDDLARNGYPRNVTAIASQDGYMMGSRFGGFSASRLRRPPNTPHMSKNLDELEKTLVDEVNSFSESLDIAREDLHKKDQEIRDVGRERQQLRIDIAELEKKLGQLSRDIADIEDTIRDEETTNINVLEEEKREEEERLRILTQQMDGIREQTHAQKEVMIGQSNELRQIEIQMEEIENRVAVLTNEVDAVSTQLAHQKHSLDHYVEKRTEYILRVDRESQHLDRIQSALDINLAKCKEIGARVAVTHDAEFLTRKIRDLRARLDEKEKQFGSREKVCNELAVKQSALDEATKAIKESNRFIKLLSKSLAQRHSAYEDFKRYISIRAKRMFSELIRKRGFRGVLMLDHDRKELNLRVDVGDAESSKTTHETSDNDPRALSGGEKSFATVCLLLALWESMASPFRALDEFDVFMDAVNRRLAMKLMIENARDAESQSQYILITPQNMSHVQGIGGPDVRVSRLNDPERSQSRLTIPGSSRV
ncbi:hypothetical protein BASA60_008601 [Batrachochytrium salamandrivorans]|nr:hypothetical protein BASA60_008601 [Batrachochytrium salamandrivorans]